MNILEKEVEDLIYEAAENTPRILTERGLFAPEDALWYRQLDLGDYGRADLVAMRRWESGKRRYLQFDIYELKKDLVDAGTFLQALRYAKGIEHIQSVTRLDATMEFTFHLVGKKVDRSSFIYLPDFFFNVYLYEYIIDFYQGMTFNTQEGFRLVNPKIPSSGEFIIDITADIPKPMKLEIVLPPDDEACDIDDLPF